jgi:hypothetical protein
MPLPRQEGNSMKWIHIERKWSEMALRVVGAGSAAATAEGAGNGLLPGPADDAPTGVRGVVTTLAGVVVPERPVA